MTIRIRIQLVILLTAFFTALPVLPCTGTLRQNVVFEELRIPRAVADQWDNGTILLTTYTYRPTTPGKHPLLVFNHGSTGPNLIPASSPQRPRCEFVQLFVDRGYVVVAPNRRGRGTSTGTYVEEISFSNAATRSAFLDAAEFELREAIADVDAVVAFMSQQSHVDPDKLLMSGQSRGGFLSVIYAAERPSLVKGVINFAGGWFGARIGGGTWGPTFVLEHYEASGMATRVPMLWIYQEGDSFYDTPFISQFFRAFSGGGGLLTSALFPADGTNGHFVINKTTLWRSLAEQYLSNISLTAEFPDFTAAERVFNWAERTYPTMFAPAAASQMIGEYYARCYNTTPMRCLGAKFGALFYYDGTNVLYAGALADYLGIAAATGN